MALNQHRIREIAIEEFSHASDQDIKAWLRNACSNWETIQSIRCFHPFQNFFPGRRDEADCLAEILQAFPSGETTDMLDLQSRFYICLCQLVETYPKESAGIAFLTEIAYRLHPDIQYDDISECSDHIAVLIPCSFPDRLPDSA